MFGGYVGAYLADTRMFNFETGLWHTLGDIPYAMSWGTGILVERSSGERVIVAPGGK